MGNLWLSMMLANSACSLAFQQPPSSSAVRLSGRDMSSALCRSPVLSRRDAFGGRVCTGLRLRQVHVRLCTCTYATDTTVRDLFRLAVGFTCRHSRRKKLSVNADLHWVNGEDVIDLLCLSVFVLVCCAVWCA